MNTRIRQRAVEILDSHEWWNWNSLKVGWDLGFIGAKDVVDFATDFLCRHPSEERDAVIDLAGAEASEDKLVRQTLSMLAPGAEKSSSRSSVSRDAWLLSSLLAVREAELSEREMLEQLAEIYADFGYPEEMEDCVYYMPSDRAPIEAFRELIASLTTEVNNDFKEATP
ncbi:DUF2247 family protein [Persicimonas caeni]|uniref:DUF2247 family protein n=1 Tax=Persicimonas caeni TaxID=2292766 RepID=A0A4Y6PWP9_PERCE|nr:DUF2247 family protein [Persicimonas caeni]QDG52175.1 DUF2247 family protein [Persicimonas caeni]QED33397.1 DUF2247 family protein [Persicimonas caeni]